MRRMGMEPQNGCRGAYSQTLGQELIEDMGTTAMKQSKKHQWKKMERNMGWNPQVPGPTNGAEGKEASMLG